MEQVFLDAISKNTKDHNLFGNGQLEFNKGKSCLLRWNVMLNEQGESSRYFTRTLAMLSTASPSLPLAKLVKHRLQNTSMGGKQAASIRLKGWSSYSVAPQQPDKQTNEHLTRHNKSCSLGTTASWVQRLESSSGKSSRESCWARSWRAGSSRNVQPRQGMAHGAVVAPPRSARF